MTARTTLMILVGLAAGRPLGADDPIPADRFDTLHKLIKPQAGELRWREIPWLTRIQEAREKSVAEDKPILLWVAADGHPLGRN